MSARVRMTGSLQALLDFINSGGIQDTALPGTLAAEATRLLKNGMSVSAFACFEHFVRGRIKELLDLVSGSDHRPPFGDLPEGLRLAATKGVIEALRFRLGQRGEGLDVDTIVDLVQDHADMLRSSRGSDYVFSEWSFGWATSNVGAGTLSDFLNACGAGRLYGEIGNLLRAVGFDYGAAGIASGSTIKLGRIAAWRHEAAHDAMISIDVELLKTRVITYLAIAFAFDVLASLAVQSLLDGPASQSVSRPDWNGLWIKELRPDGEQFVLVGRDGTEEGRYYTLRHCQDSLGDRVTPLSGVIVVRDAQGRLVNWSFC